MVLKIKSVEIMNKNIDLVVPAAGMGTRSGLNYPKTLFKIKNKEIILNIFEKTNVFCKNKIVIVSPSGYSLIKKKLDSNIIDHKLLIQKKPKGMGDAVKKISKLNKLSENILLIWGDIPFFKKTTIAKLIKLYFKNKCDFAFPTILIDNPYTYVKRKKNGQVNEVIETKNKKTKYKFGERELGIFIFKRKLVLDLLKKNLPNKYDNITGEHSFLYIIKHLVKENKNVMGFNISKKIETVSLNYINDLKDYI